MADVYKRQTQHIVQLLFSSAPKIHRRNILYLAHAHAPVDDFLSNLKQRPQDVYKRQGLTGKKNFTVVTVSKNQQEDNLGIIRRTLEIFEKYRVEVEHIPSGIDSFSVVVATEQVEGCIYDLSLIHI